MSNIYSNIWKMYVLQALRWFMVFMPIIVLFFQENGLTMKEVLLLQSLFSIAIVIFEIPSGYFSDVLGRKTTLIIGSTLGFVGFAIYSLSYSFWGFLFAELTLGLGSSFISGTDSALIYDTLVECKKEDKYTQIEGRYISIGSFSEAIASILGGFLALISLRFPLYIESAIAFFTIPLAFSLIEPKRIKAVVEENPFKEIIKIVKYSVHGHPEIKWLIFYSGFISASTLTFVWFIQPFLELVGLPLALFGVVWAILNVAVAIFALNAHRYEKFLGRKKSLISLIILIFIGYISLAFFQSIWAIPLILLFYFARGIQGPIIKDYLNKLISSNIRATVLSVKSLVGRLIFACISPFIGAIADVYSMGTAFIISGTFFFVFGTITLLFLHKNKAL